MMLRVPLLAKKKPKAASSVGGDWREKLENLFEESLPTLCFVEVKGRTGTSKGRMSEIGLSQDYEPSEEDDAASLADDLAERITEHAESFGPHRYRVTTYISDGEKVEVMPGEVEFTIRETGQSEQSSEKSEALELLKFQNKTIKEQDGIITRQAKSMESMASMFGQLMTSMGPVAQVEIAKLEAQERMEQRRLEHEETLNGQNAFRDAVAPLMQQAAASAGPAFRQWMEWKMKQDQGTSQNTSTNDPNEPPPWERMRVLLDSLTDQQRARMRNLVSRDSWDALQKLGDVDTAEAWDSMHRMFLDELVAEHGATGAFQLIGKIRAELQPDQVAVFDSLVQP